MNKVRQSLEMLTVVFFLMGLAGCDEGPEEPVPTTIEITPNSATFSHAGATKNFRSVVRDQHGAVMDVAMSWSASDLSVFTVTGSGNIATVIAVDNGTGTLTATADHANGAVSVTVERTPTKLEIVSGNDQEGPRGEPLVARLVDQGGTFIADWPVTFTPGDRSGSVGDSTVNTDREGLASTTWILDRRIQRQTVVAEAGDLEESFAATAVADPPIPDYAILGDLMVGRTDPTDADTIEITALITNLDAGAAAFPVQVTVDGEPLSTTELPPIEFGDTVAAVFLAIGVPSGHRSIGVVINPNDQIDEWDGGNNEAFIDLTVLHLGEIALGDSVRIKSDERNEVLLFRVQVDEHSDDVLRVQISGGVGVPMLGADFNERPDQILGYRCIIWTSERQKHCEFSQNKGTYYIAIWTWSPYETTLTVTSEGTAEDPFDIELHFVDHGTKSQDSIIKVAAERWESMMGPGAVDDTNPIATRPGSCQIPRFPVFPAGTVIDDIRFIVVVDSIDGPGNRVASSYPCQRRWRIWFPSGGRPVIHWVSGPIFGIMVLDSADISKLESDGVLEPVVMHQMAHGMGFHRNYWGWDQTWDRKALIRNPSLPSNPNADTHFRGSLTVNAFDVAGGVGYPDGKVPVENGAVIGVSDSHWRASVFGNELMTPNLTGDSQPISEVTLAAIYETGFETKLIKADPFTLSLTRARVAATPPGPVVYLGNDATDWGRFQFPPRIMRVDTPGSGSRSRRTPPGR